MLANSSDVRVLRFCKLDSSQLNKKCFSVDASGYLPSCINRGRRYRGTFFVSFPTVLFHNFSDRFLKKFGAVPVVLRGT